LNESVERSTRFIDLDGAPAPTAEGVYDGSTTCTKEERSGGGIAEESCEVAEEMVCSALLRAQLGRCASVVEELALRIG
jgi:hypothetical protein